MSPAASEEGASFSDVLAAVAARPGAQLTLNEIVEAFGERGFGALILMIALISLLPWPPGSKLILSVPIILLSLELAFQRPSVWLPRWALGRSMPRKVFARGVGKAIRPIRFVERLSRPRLPWLTGEAADVATGAACVFLAVMMALPVPFGDMLPGVTLILFGLGIMQRDGVVVILAALGTAACVAYLFLVWRAVMLALEAAGGWLSGLF